MQKIFKLTLILLIFLVYSCCLFADSSQQQQVILPKEENIHIHTLDNGLTLIVKEDHTTPIVTISSLVKTGSHYEGNLTGSGISHLVEHMLFKSSKKYETGTLHQVVKSLGGRTNGYTTFDYTYYYMTVPKASFNKTFRLMSDILQDASFTEEEIEEEKQVILKEMNMRNDDPYKVVSENLWEKAYMNHPYKYPVIGRRNLFMDLDKDDVTKYYKRNYSPENIIISVIGDIASSEVFLKAEEEFSGFKMQPYLQHISSSEPRQLTKRTIIEEKDIKLTYLALGFKSTSINSEDLYALDLLANILAEGRSSILSQLLKDKLQIVYSIVAYNYTPKDKGLFVIQAVLDKDNLDQVTKAVVKQIDNIKTNGITQKQLKKAKNSILTRQQNHLQSIGNQAEDLATSLYYTADANFTNTYLEKIKLQNPEDIKKVAKKYLKDSRLTISILQPEAYSYHVSEKEDKKTSEKEKKYLEKIELENGITVIIKPDYRTDLVDIQAVLKGGLRFEDKENNGVCNLMAHLLLDGTNKLSKPEINQLLEEKGIQANTFSQNNSFGLSLNLQRKDLDFAIKTLKQMLISPAFKKSCIDQRKQLIKGQIKAEQDKIFQYSFNILKNNFFKNHPYSLNPLGTIESIDGISREQIIDFYNKMVVPSNLTLAVFGNIDSEETIKKIKHYFGQMPPKQKLPHIALTYKNYHLGQNQIVKETQKRQTVIMIAFSAPSAKNKNRYAFSVLDSLLSGAGSRLFHNLREQKSLAYQVGSFTMTGFEPGMWTFYIVTSEETREKAKGGLLEEIKKIKDLKFTQEEVEQTKRYLIGQHYINLQTNSALSFKCALDEMYSLGYDNYKEYEKNIAAVTIKDIEKIINEYIDLDNYTLLIIKPRKIRQ